MERITAKRPPRRALRRLRDSRFGVLPALLTCAGLFLGAQGCSEYKDPYTGICPTIDDLEVFDVTSSSATIFWRSDHLMVAYLLVQPSDGPERVIRGYDPGLEHEVRMSDLFPDTQYRVTLVKDIGNEEDQVVPCGADELFSFRTRPESAEGNARGNPVSDPETPVNP